MITAEAIKQVDMSYGRRPETAATKLSYHNGLHTRNVITDFMKLAGVVVLPIEGVVFGRAAAAAHDISQGGGRGKDESASAQWLADKLEAAGCDERQVGLGRLAVIGTEPIFSNGRLTGQQSSQLEYPGKLHGLTARLLACADLGRLYAPDGPYLSHLLFKELNGERSPEPLSTMLDFQRSQIHFLEDFKYPLKQVSRELSLHKKTVTQYAARLAIDIEVGRLESWQDLMAADKKFMQTLA
jgi:hypothetical protein